jgi:Ca-activated chloride channel family protein
VLVTVAVVIAAAVMATLSTQAIMASAPCARNPLLVKVAAADDIAPAIQQVGRYFNRLHRLLDRRCVEVQVAAVQPAIAAAMVDGKTPPRGRPAIDAWIPDSSLWVGVARSGPAGAQRVQTTGIDVARSPLMIVMPRSAASRRHPLGSSTGWNFLLPPSAGGPPSAAGVQVELPDPEQSSAGLATVVELRRLLGTGPASGENFSRFAFGAHVTAQYDSPAALESLVALAKPPQDQIPVTVASEQAVVQYDLAHPDRPLAARYPSGGTPELDYPYVLTTTSRPELTAAAEFGQVLRQDYAAAVVRFDGFRSAPGTADRTPASFGLARQQLRLASLASPAVARATLKAWNKLRIGTRLLALADISGSMAQPAVPGGPSLEEELTQTADQGVLLFPDSTRMGLWEFASDLDGTRPYRRLVSVGPMSAEVGLITRRQQIEQLNQALRPRAGSAASLYDTTLAAYRYMISTYRPHYGNFVLVLTGGADSAPGDISPGRLLRRVHALSSPARHVAIVFLVLGPSGNFAALQRIAAATGGSAFRITDPAEINKDFFQSLAHTIAPG